MRQRILLIILGVVILLAIYTFFLRPKPKVAQAISKVKTQAQEKTASMQEKVTSNPVTKDIANKVEKPIKTVVSTLTAKPEATALESKIEKGQWGSDPFNRDWVLGTELTDLKLKAITQSGEKAYALINDQILETGEVISGKRIVSIDKDKVVLEQNDRTFTLFLGQ